jgi:hypothetical protein
MISESSGPSRENSILSLFLSELVTIFAISVVGCGSTGSLVSGTVGNHVESDSSSELSSSNTTFEKQLNGGSSSMTSAQKPWNIQNPGADCIIAMFILGQYGTVFFYLC